MDEQAIRAKYSIPKDFSFFGQDNTSVNFCWISPMGFIRRVIRVNLSEDSAEITWIGGKHASEPWPYVKG